MPGKPNRRGFGYIRRLPSKRVQASYVGPDLERHTAPSTFTAKPDAEAWLSTERKLIETDQWLPPDQRDRAREVEVLTFGTFADEWLTSRTLKPRTRQHYQQLLDRFLLPEFGDAALTSITSAQVRAWHLSLGIRTPTLRAHAYSLLRTITRSAVADEVIPASPCTLPRAGSSKRVHQPKPATLSELRVLVAAMPDHLTVATLLAAWCALRYGEMFELRRKDIDLDAGVLRVRRGVVWIGGVPQVGPPKSAAGIRDVSIPPHLLDAVHGHLANHCQPGPRGLLFPGHQGGHMTPAVLYGSYYSAREAAGRPDLRWHDLRHTGAVLAASTGATLAELMSRLGHSTPQAAMRYQHTAQGRDQQIARALSAISAAEPDAR